MRSVGFLTLRVRSRRAEAQRYVAKRSLILFCALEALTENALYPICQVKPSPRWFFIQIDKLFFTSSTTFANA